MQTSIENNVSHVPKHFAQITQFAILNSGKYYKEDTIP